MSADVKDETRETRGAVAAGRARLGANERAVSATRDEARPSLATRLLGGLRLLLVALWLGGAVFFSFVVAPTAFAVLPTHELAGAVVTRTIAVVNVGGFVVALLLMATGLFVKGDEEYRGRARAVELVSLAVVAVSCAVGHWIVAARMVALRASMGWAIDRVPVDDPLRVAFNSLHGYSVALMCAAMLAGAVALFSVGRGRACVK